VRVVGKLLAVLGLGIVAAAVGVVAAAGIDDPPGWVVALVLATPLIGTLLGGWLVSLHSTAGGRVGWILGGGVGMAALIYLALLVFFFLVVAIGLAHWHQDIA
jgi:hypothetical protein